MVQAKLDVQTEMLAALHVLVALVVLVLLPLVPLVPLELVLLLEVGPCNIHCVVGTGNIASDQSILWL